jgi:hypothetical protein
MCAQCEIAAHAADTVRHRLPNVAGPMLAKLQDARDALARGSVTAARNKLEDFISYVGLRTGRAVTAEAAELLSGDARYVLGTL